MTHPPDHSLWRGEGDETLTRRTFVPSIGERLDTAEARCAALETELGRLRGLLQRSVGLACYAVDIPSKELEAQEFLNAVREALAAG